MQNCFLLMSLSFSSLLSSHFSPCLPRSLFLTAPVSVSPVLFHASANQILGKLSGTLHNWNTNWVHFLSARLIWINIYFISSVGRKVLDMVSAIFWYLTQGQNGHTTKTKVIHRSKSMYKMSFCSVGSLLYKNANVLFFLLKRKCLFPSHLNHQNTFLCQLSSHTFLFVLLRPFILLLSFQSPHSFIWLKNLNLHKYYPAASSLPASFSFCLCLSWTLSSSIYLSSSLSLGHFPCFCSSPCSETLSNYLYTARLGVKIAFLHS